MPLLGYSFLSKPRLWPTDTLQEARLECVRSLKDKRLKGEKREKMVSLLQETEAVLLGRGARLRSDKFS